MIDDEPTILDPQDFYILFEKNPGGCALFGIETLEQLDGYVKDMFKEEFWPDRLKKGEDSKWESKRQTSTGKR